MWLYAIKVKIQLIHVFSNISSMSVPQTRLLCRTLQACSSLGEQLENILEPKPLVESEVVGELGIAQVDVYCGKGLDPHDEVVDFHCGGYSEYLRRFQQRDHHEICTAQQTAALFHKSDSHVAAVGMFGLDGRWLADV